MWKYVEFSNTCVCSGSESGGKKSHVKNIMRSSNARVDTRNAVDIDRVVVRKRWRARMEQVVRGPGRFRVSALD